jgi:hypothetical protein
MGFLDKPEVRYLGQSVHNYPNEIISRLSPRHSHGKIYSNLFPLPLGYTQELQQSCRSLMLSLDPLSGVEKSKILNNVSLHFVPPIGYLEVL